MSTVVKDLGAVSAYAYAVEKGYTGTEAEFAELMADYAEVGQRAEDAADSALESKTAAQTAATTATNKATEATTAATTATNKAAEAQADADAAALDASQAMSAASTATTKATEATTAAATATSAKTDAVAANTAAQSAKTAAQTAQTGAETAAASVSASAAQIATNTEDITQLKSELTAVTERRNVLPSIASQKTIYGVSVRYDNGKLTVAGTATGDGGRHTHMIEFTLPAGTYAISKYSVESSGDNPAIFVQSGSTIIGNYGSTTNTFTLASETLLNLGVNVVNGNTYNYSCDLQIESGSTPTMYIPPSGSAYDMVARDDISKQQTEIVRIGNTTRNSINPYGITLVQNKYINSNNGNVGASYAFSYASEEYIPVAPLSQIDFSDYANTTHQIESVVGLAFYDSNNHFISGISYSEYSDEIHATVPANASKMRITVYNDSIDTFVLKRDNVNSLINLYEPYDENPLVTIKETAGMLSIFHTVGCIGDSLASGESAYKTDGVTHYVDLYDFSWGQCLARMTGNTYYNFSAGGLSAKTWLTSQYCTTAFDGNHKCDAYIIGLGQNDKNQGYTVGTTADIDLSDYTQNADTFCGNYGKIIQMIQEHQPKAKIFVITDPLEGVNTYGINNAIRSVASLFSNVYVLDFYAYGANYLTNGFLHNQYRSGHFNALGYQYVARMIASYIDWYVMNHYSDFSQVEFIGTEYSW